MISLMRQQNHLGKILFKNEMSTSIVNRIYKQAFNYYGYKEMNKNGIIYPTPILRNSKTFMKQASLANLPVAPLNRSLDKYLNAVKPLLNDEEFKKTKFIVEDFRKPNGIGEKLQRLLYERASKLDNWLAQWWLDKVYLEPRYPLPINVNPAILCPKSDFKSLDDKLIFTTNFIYGLIDYKYLIDNQQLPVEKYLDSPLCMDQYTKIIATCRIPFRKIDKLKIPAPYLNRPKHITVIYKNRIFNLQIIDSNSEKLLSKSVIYTNLKTLIGKTLDTDAYGLGIMTSADRDLWADTYESLRKDETNRRNFDSIHDSLFVLCLDDNSNKNFNFSDERSSAAAQLLTGNKDLSSNRWFDKNIQVIIGENGIYGLNFEHSVAEGLPYANLCDHALDFISKCDNSDVKLVEGEENLFEELKFNLSPDIKRTISNAKDSFAKQIDNLELFILQFDHFGKNFPKAHKLSPDALIQVALQLAFYKLHKKWCSAYESGSLRRFKLGRTDIIRSCSKETVEFLQSTSDNNKKSIQERSVLLKNAINAHSLCAKNVLNFEMFDRHLMGLKLIAIENNYNLPELYEDVAFKKLCYYQISSSQISSKHSSVSVFGPAVIDGYGICYNVMENKLLFGLTAFNSCKETSAKEYGKKLSESLVECQEIVLGNTIAKL